MRKRIELKKFILFNSFDDLTGIMDSFYLFSINGLIGITIFKNNT